MLSEIYFNLINIPKAVSDIEETPLRFGGVKGAW